VTPPNQAYRSLLQARKSYRAFSQGTTIPGEIWRGFLNDALKPIFRLGVKLPAAGGFSDYEIFLLAHRLSGKKRGLYHVSPTTRGALRLNQMHIAVEPLEAWFRWATGGGSASQGALVLVGRGAAIRAKYGKRGTELLYQNVGVVQAHLYLTVTSWGLNGCAIGWVEQQLVTEWVELQRGDAIVAFAFGL
jgi:SagB-type dehydrogenase family enzyme